MSIQFLKLPWLTQLEVLKQLKIEEVFVISLCSEKLKRKVQSLNLKPGIVKYYFMENAIVAVVKDSEHDEVIHNVAMVTRVQEDPDDSFITIKLGGKKVTCKWCTDVTRNPTISLDYSEAEENLIIDAFHRHMRDLFRFKSRVQLVLSSNYSEENLTLIEDVTDTLFMLEELSTPKLEYILDTHKNQDCILIQSELTGPQLKNDSRLWGIKTLGFHFTCTRISQVIANFQGQHLLFDHVLWTLEHWIQMIWKWKRREAYHNLKTMSASAPRDIPIVDPVDDLTEELDLKEWDGKRRPQKYIFDPKIINNPPVTIDCSNWKDIQQDESGKWASIGVSQTAIMFLVWD